MSDDIHKRLKEWRVYLHVTQPRFAKMAGLPKRSLQNYEEGKQKPGAPALEKIATTGVSIDWLLTGTGEMVSQEFLKQKKKEKRIAELREKWEKENTPNTDNYMEKIEHYISLVEEKYREKIISELLQRLEGQIKFQEAQREVEKLKALLKSKSNEQDEIP